MYQGCDVAKHREDVYIVQLWILRNAQVDATTSTKKVSGGRCQWEVTHLTPDAPGARIHVALASGAINQSDRNASAARAFKAS